MNKRVRIITNGKGYFSVHVKRSKDSEEICILPYTYESSAKAVAGVYRSIGYRYTGVYSG